MSKEEFICRQKVVSRASNRWALPLLAGFFGLLFANIPLAAALDRHRPLPWWMHLLYLFFLLAFVGGYLFLVIWLTKRTQRRAGLLCPHCRQALLGLSGQVIVATGRCGHCGERVLAESDPPTV